MKQVILESIENWQRNACPSPTRATLSKALGYHLEEIEEMLKAITLDDAHEHSRRDACTMLQFLSEALKQGQATVVTMDRKEVCDGLADQIVTGVGFGYRAGMDIPEATVRVDASNWTKYDENGKPVYDLRGKIARGPNFVPADLAGCY